MPDACAARSHRNHPILGIRPCPQVCANSPQNGRRHRDITSGVGLPGEPPAQVTSLAFRSVSNLRWIPGEVRNSRAASTITIPMVAMTDGSGFRPGSRKQMCVAVFNNSRRSGGLRRRSSRRSGPVGSASTNCDTSGRNLPGSLADGRLPCAIRPMRSVKHRRHEPAAHPQERKGGRPRGLRDPANVPSLECRCRGNSIRERGPCGQDERL